MVFNWLSLATGLCYVILGVFVIIYKFFVIYLEPNVAYGLGAILIVYGLFRTYRGFKKLQKSKDEV